MKIILLLILLLLSFSCSTIPNRQYNDLVDYRLYVSINNVTSCPEYIGRAAYPLNYNLKFIYWDKQFDSELNQCMLIFFLTDDERPR